MIFVQRKGILMALAASAQVPHILPISDLRTNLSSVCDLAEETGQPVYMTKNGKAKLVVFDSEAYEELLQQQRYTTKLREAEIEARYVNKIFSKEEMDVDMQRLFDYWGI